jgi:hypothetical protein
VDIYDSADALVAGSPFDLAEVGATARYTGASFTPLVVGTFTARFVVYSDAGHTIEARRYSRDQDSYVVTAVIATAAALATVQADTDNIQTRLPATLSGGRMRSQVEGLDADTITAAAIAAGAIGTSEAPLLANLDATVSSRATIQDRVVASFALNPSTVVLDGNVWLERDGELLAAVTSLTADFFNSAGAALFSLVDVAPDAQGIFRVTSIPNPVGFSVGVEVYVRLTIVAPSGTFVSVKGIQVAG